MKAAEAHAGQLDVIVRPFEARDEARWNDFVRAHAEGTFFHLAEWKTVIERAFGHRMHYLLAESERGIEGVLPLGQTRSLIFGHSLISTPFCVYGGAIATSEPVYYGLVNEACRLAEKLRVDYLELRNRRRAHPDWPYSDLYVYFRKELSADNDENLKAIPRKQRAMVRKGIKKGLTGHLDPGVERLYDVYSAMVRNLGTPVFSRRYFEVLREVFGDACDVVTIEHEGEPVASVMSFVFRDEVLPYYGGGTRAARDVAGNDFLYWDLMCRATDRGLKVFDYGRSKRETGAAAFKRHWGFEPQPLFYEYYLVRAKEVPNKSPTNPKYEKAIELWQRLPLWATRLLGPPVAKYLG